MREELRAEAEEEARGAILIQAIAEREGITVTDADCRSASPSSRPRARRTRRSCAPSWRRTNASTRSQTQIREQKTLDMLIAQAKITDEDPRLADRDARRGER